VHDILHTLTSVLAGRGGWSRLEDDPGLRTQLFSPEGGVGLVPKR
jgi:hypothetical protein